MVGVAVDGDRDAPGTIGLAESVVGGVVRNDRPAVTGDGVDDSNAVAAPLQRQARQPGGALGSQQLPAARRRLGYEAARLLWHLALIRQGGIGVAEDARPPELADPIDDLDRVGAAERQVTTQDDDARSNLLEVGEDGLEGGQVAMDVRDDRDPHSVDTLSDARRQLLHRGVVGLRNPVAVNLEVQ
jgi:hypothetical protein